MYRLQENIPYRIQSLRRGSNNNTYASFTDYANILLDYCE